MSITQFKQRPQPLRVRGRTFHPPRLQTSFSLEIIITFLTAPEEHFQEADRKIINEASILRAQRFTKKMFF